MIRAEAVITRAIREVLDEIATQKAIGIYQGDIGAIVLSKARDNGVYVVDLLRAVRRAQAG